MFILRGGVETRDKHLSKARFWRKGVDFSLEEAVKTWGKKESSKLIFLFKGRKAEKYSVACIIYAPRVFQKSVLDVRMRVAYLFS